jgi:hypothetical protein
MQFCGFMQFGKGGWRSFRRSESGEAAIRLDLENFSNNDVDISYYGIISLIGKK